MAKMQQGNAYLNITTMPQDPRGATKFLTDTIINKIHPLIIRIRSKLQCALNVEDFAKIRDVYTLCSNQIRKCLQMLFDIFRMEHKEHILLQDSRQCTLERLSWCVTRLLSVEQLLNNTSDKTPLNEDSSSNDSILVTPMYFVDWIDHAFDLLSKLANAIYKTDYKNSNVLCLQWQHDVADYASSLQISIDELLLSAMTLCKYCLNTDQHVIKARCQVVLRETKALLGELIEGDLDSAFKVTPHSLKLPIMPSNVNVLIDVLKDVLYVLETNTNTSLLGLLVNCFSTCISPVDILKEHFEKSKGTCSCHVKSGDNITDDCSFVKGFDLYNERLLQIGSFAVSCSSDHRRILSLRSGLATLEALDPHLVPALMLSPHGQHSALLADSWRREVREIRDNVFLIVDPLAFAEKSKQLMHGILLEILKRNQYDNRNVREVINTGSVMHDFFSVYNNQEPEALTHHEKLLPLLEDLNKVQMECKIVSNLLSSGDDLVYDVRKIKNDKEVSMDQLIKRLKLLYSLVNKINCLLHPKDDGLECELDDDVPLLNNITHTIHAKNANTYVHSPRKLTNFSRSIFARTTDIRSSTTNFPLSKLTNHLKAKWGNELSFSVQLDELFNLSKPEAESNKTENIIKNKQHESVRENSVLYNFCPKKRLSLRKAVLSRHHNMPFGKETNVNVLESTKVSDEDDLVDEATSLQITDILNQMNDMTTTFSRTKPALASSTSNPPENVIQRSNTVSINMNDGNTTISKHIWNIPVNASTVETPLDNSTETVASNVTLPSNVTTLERISDLDLVESKLTSLKSLEVETSL